MPHSEPEAAVVEEAKEQEPLDGQSPVDVLRVVLIIFQFSTYRSFTKSRQRIYCYRSFTT